MASTGWRCPTATRGRCRCVSSSTTATSRAPASSKACGGATAASTSWPPTPAARALSSTTDGPDNITVSPYGGLVVAEDGDGVQHLFGATERGRTYPIARNELNAGTAEDPEYSEFAGVTFSPDGRTLYASIQSPGILLAITGPWKRQRR